MHYKNQYKCCYRRWNKSKTAEGKTVVNGNEWNMPENVSVYRTEK